MLAGDPRLSFDPRYDCRAVLDEPLRLLSVATPETMAARIAATLDLVGLSAEVLPRRAVRLSPPNALRLALARALITDPRLLLIDVAFEALDPFARNDALALIGRLRADLGVATLLFSRDFDMLRSMVDRVLILERGHIVDGGRPQALAETPRHPATEALVKARWPEL